MSAEQARQIIAEVSHENLDECVRPKSFTSELEESVRGHIHQELTSWLFFRKLAADCSRANVSLHGFAMLWERSAMECLMDMHWLEKYLISRGGRSKPTTIEPPQVEFKDCPVEPVEPTRKALMVQKELLQDLERLCTLSIRCGEFSLTDALQRRFLRKESRYVKDLGDLLQQVVRVSKQPGLGIYDLDSEIRQNKGCLPWGIVNDPDRQNIATASVTTGIREGLHGHKKQWSGSGGGSPKCPHGGSYKACHHGYSNKACDDGGCCLTK